MQNLRGHRFDSDQGQPLYGSAGRAVSVRPCGDRGGGHLIRPSGTFQREAPHRGSGIKDSGHAGPQGEGF